MKKLICVFIILLSILQANSQTTRVGFECDDDGNMKLRKVVEVVPQGAKRNEEAKPIEEKIGELKIVIYPNPTNGIMQLSISGLDTKQNNYYSLYSLNGSLLKKEIITVNMTEINISSFTPGTYLMDINLGDKVSRWKVIKK